MQIATHVKSIGSGTSMMIRILIEPYNMGSKIIYAGDWGMDMYGQVILGSLTGVNGNSSINPIIFKAKPSTKNDVAFQRLVITATKINGTVGYER